ncbi:MAG: hypothetical protein ABI581_01550, partial [Sediminibacterium sp.]
RAGSGQYYFDQFPIFIKYPYICAINMNTTHNNRNFAASVSNLIAVIIVIVIPVLPGDSCCI